MAPFDLARRFVGVVQERPGADHHPFIQWCHELVELGTRQPDEVPWCSSFVNAIAFMCGLPRSKSAAARSWLSVGEPVGLDVAKVGDIVVLKRGTQAWQGHVGFFAGVVANQVRVLGGNQGNAVSVATFPVSDVIGVRRLHAATTHANGGL